MSRTAQLAASYDLREFPVTEPRSTPVPKVDRYWMFWLMRELREKRTWGKV